MKRDDALAWVVGRLDWMEEREIWPKGQRYLWTDAFGLVLLVSLFRMTEDEAYLDRGEWLVAEVGRVLGRERGIRIGEAADRHGQYYHYLAMWLFALERLGRLRPSYLRRAVDLVHEIHEPFLVPGRGLWWKMREDLSGPEPGFGLGAMDAFDGWVVYRLLARHPEVGEELAGAIESLGRIVEASYRDLTITQDLGLGMMLWLTSFHPSEPWAMLQAARCLEILDSMWIDPPGYFCRHPRMEGVKFAFTNYGVSLGLQAVDAWPPRVDRLEAFFEGHRSGDEYDLAAITHVMACTSRLPGDFLPGD